MHLINFQATYSFTEQLLFAKIYFRGDVQFLLDSFVGLLERKYFYKGAYRIFVKGTFVFSPHHPTQHTSLSGFTFPSHLSIAVPSSATTTTMHQAGYHPNTGPPDMAQLQATMRSIELACSSIQVHYNFELLTSVNAFTARLAASADKLL